MNNGQPFSKLNRKHPPVAKEVEWLVNRAQDLGAQEGAQRLKHICNQYDQLTPNSAYLWIDPYSFQREIEEEQSHRASASLVHFLRNLFSLAPIISTWTTLLLAVDKYQHNWSLHPEDHDIPFLQQWQQGFHGTTFLTFTLSAGTTVVLLLCYLLSLAAANRLDRAAHNLATEFVQHLQQVFDKLAQCIEMDSTASLAQQSDSDKIVNSIRQVVDGAVKAVVDATAQSIDMNRETQKSALLYMQQMVVKSEQALQQVVSAAEKSIGLSNNAAQQAIHDVNSRAQALFDQEVKPLIHEFRHDMGNLQKELGNYQTRLNDLTYAARQVADASQGLEQMSTSLTEMSTSLTRNAESYTAIGQNIEMQIARLNDTQDQLLSGIEGVEKSIATVAVNMSSATTNVENATSSVRDLTRELADKTGKIVADAVNNAHQATQLVQGVHRDIAQATMNMMRGVDQTTNQIRASVGQTTQALGQVSQSLQATSTELQQTASVLSSIKSAGFWEWLTGKPKQRQRGRI